MIKKMISFILIATVLLTTPVLGSAASGSAYGSYGPDSSYAEPEPETARKDVILFGAYEQDDVAENGPEPIEWLMMMADEYRALLVSRYALDAVPYQEGYVDVTWETCELRPWMNETFLKTAFTEEEQSVIVPVTLDNSNEYESCTMWRTIKAENDTTDTVFALSCRQAEDLFGHRRGYSGGSNQTFLQGDGVCKPTAFAAAHGASTDEHGNCYWWLRSPAVTTFYASYVSPMGTEGATHIYAKHIGVRPAIWVDVKLLKDLLTVGDQSNTSLSESGNIEVTGFTVEKEDGNNTLAGGFNYYQVSLTIRNNSDETIELLSPDMVFIDANGTIVHHQYPQESSRVRGGQSAVLTGYCDLSLNPVAVYVDHYTYTMNGTHQDDLVEEPFIYELP